MIESSPNQTFQKINLLLSEFLLILILLFLQSCPLTIFSQSIKKDKNQWGTGKQINQQSKVQRIWFDSVKKILVTAKDTTKINTLNALSSFYAWPSTDTARIIAGKALKEAELIHYTKGMATAYTNLAWSYWLLEDNYIEMESFCNKAIALLNNTSEKELYAYSWYLLGCALWVQSKFTASAEAYNKAGELYLIIGDELSYANMNAFIAGVEEERGYYGKSLEFSVKWLDIADKYNNKRYLDIWAALYKNIGDYETSTDYYKQAANYAMQMQHPHELAYFTQLIGEVFFLQKNYDSARIYYNSAINISPKNHKLHAQLGELYIAIKQYNAAFVYLNIALNKAVKANNRNRERWILLRLSRAYIEINNVTKALSITQKLLHSARQTGARQYIRDAEFLLYQLFLQTGKQDSAFYYLQKYTVLKDSIDKDLSAQKLAFYKKRIEDEKNHSWLMLLNEENNLQQQIIKQAKQQKKFLITGIAVLFLIGLILFSNILLKRKNEKQRLENRLEIQKLESQKEQAELKHQATELKMLALRLQMNPHFIFNALNSINSFILKENKTKASEYLTKFSKLIRLILQNSRATYITLEAELKALQLYLELEALRFNYHFAFKISIGEELDISALKVLPLFIQPYVENAIWHGLMQKEEKGHLDIALFQKDDNLYCKITDDGIGRKKAKELKSKSVTTHKSLGMQITASRIETLQHLNQIDMPIEIKDLILPDGSPGGTEVLLKIPMIYD